MTIPATKETCWSELDADGKRATLLRAAGEVFARSGLEAPMPEVAAAAGAGIGSVYRQFSSKRELLAALVIERLESVREDAEAAVASPVGPWAALVALLWDYAERQAGDDVVGEAIACVSTDPEVDRAYAATTAALERLLEAGRAEGRLRPDATTEDLRLLFAATRAAGQLGSGAWRRMLELGIDALDTQAR
ncbi:MAG TPA: TetR/AcrR family transcriptional regulator [Solirubrobacterales bacterium]|nr:TetR/AcrR family transcriptional regulator [Solirubrobacterales bacterium]